MSLSVCQRAMSVLRREEIIEVAQGRGSLLGNLTAFHNNFTFYGVIYPYNPASAFSSTLNSCITEAFSSLKPSPFPLIASSLRKSDDECSLAKQMKTNRVEGILLSPVTNSQNAEFFKQLSRKIPVMLFDQDLPGSGLPLVKFDYAAVGRELGRLLKRCGRKHVLILQQELSNQSLNEFSDALGEFVELTFFEQNLFKILGVVTRLNDPEPMALLVQQIREKIIDSACDAVFCPYDVLLDELVVNGMPDSLLDRLQLATLRNDTRLPSLRFLQRDIWQWHTPLVQLISTAVHRLTCWKANHHVPVGVKKVVLPRMK